MMLKENLGPVDEVVRPGLSQTPLVRCNHSITCRAGSIYSIYLIVDSVLLQQRPLLHDCPCSTLGLIISTAPGSTTVVTSIVAPCSTLHSQIQIANVSMVSMQADRSSNPVAQSISLSGIGLSSLLSLAYPAGSAGWTYVVLIIGLM
jgi:hypothetical protein